jgi:hypothetical protein
MRTRSLSEHRRWAQGTKNLHEKRLKADLLDPLFVNRHLRPGNTTTLDVIVGKDGTVDLHGQKARSDELEGTPIHVTLNEWLHYEVIPAPTAPVDF